jgi:hypothetical protein
MAEKHLVIGFTQTDLKLVQSGNEFIEAHGIVLFQQLVNHASEIQSRSRVQVVLNKLEKVTCLRLRDKWCWLSLGLISCNLKFPKVLGRYCFVDVLTNLSANNFV